MWHLCSVTTRPKRCGFNWGHFGLSKLVMRSVRQVWAVYNTYGTAILSMSKIGDVQHVWQDSRKTYPRAKSIVIHGHCPSWALSFTSSVHHEQCTSWAVPFMNSVKYILIRLRSFRSLFGSSGKTNMPSVITHSGNYSSILALRAMKASWKVIVKSRRS